MPDIRRQRSAPPASCARLQSWQLSPHTCNTGADQGLVADEPAGEADQDRREGREPRTLCRLPDGRGRHPPANVPGDSAADFGTAAATTASASVRYSMVRRSTATNGRSAPKMARKLARSGCPTAVRARATGQQSAPRTGLAGRLEKRKYSPRVGVHLGKPGSTGIPRSASFCCSSLLSWRRPCCCASGKSMVRCGSGCRMACTPISASSAGCCCCCSMCADAGKNDLRMHLGCCTFTS